MSEKKQFDVVVIGAGPGGYVAAIRAAQLGLKVGVVERDAMGGVCLNWGCIPTKALLKAAELKRGIEHGADFGIVAKVENIDFKKVIQRSRDVAGKLSKGVAFLMKKNKIETVEGEASFLNDRALKVKLKAGGECEVGFNYAIVATGARAKQIPGVLEADGKLIWTAREAMVPEQMPKDLLVIGGGAIGVEFASFYNALGVKVTLVEAQDRIVPAEDAEISKLLKKDLEGFGMEILTNAKVSNLKPNEDHVTADINGESKRFDRAILAIGVSGNVEGLGLEALKILSQNGPQKGELKVNRATYQTEVANVYAIGDVIGAPWLAHVASHEGVICAEQIAHKAGKLGHVPHPLRYDNIPGCTYCTPQVGSTGLTEAQALAKGHEVKIGRFNYQANGKALAMGESSGLVKTVFDKKTGELLGAHIIGAEATEMISTFVLGRSMEAVEEDFMHACLPHPTLSEMIAESVLDSEGRALNA